MYRLFVSGCCVIVLMVLDISLVVILLCGVIEVVNGLYFNSFVEVGIYIWLLVVNGCFVCLVSRKFFYCIFCLVVV